MSDKPALWGQIGATFYLTQAEMDTLLAFDSESETLFIELVKDRRYEINDQFYSPDFCNNGNKDIFIQLTDIGRMDTVWAARPDKDRYGLKIWCRLGIDLTVDDRELHTLEKQDDSAANLIYDLVEAGRYQVEGSCSFEDGVQEEGNTLLQETQYIDVFLRPAELERQGGPTMVGP